jgi:hypothetical protein
MDSKTNAEALKDLIDPSRIAKRGDWKTKPMPRKHLSIEFEYQFEAREMQVIRKGVLPYQMEDKWFIYYHRGNYNRCKLFLHRSWTGLCPYVGYFKEDVEGGAILYRIDVNREIEQTSDDRTHEILSFFSIIGVMMFGGEPLILNSGSDADTIALWSTFGRAYFKEE